MSVTIKKFHPHQSGKFIGFLDISVPAWNTTMEIRGCKVFNGPHGQFVSLPSREYEKDGETKYAPLIAVEDESVYKNLMKAVNHAWREYASTMQQPEPQPVQQGQFQGNPNLPPPQQEADQGLPF